MKREAIAEVDGFEESLGVGGNTVYLGGEDTDILLRLICKSCNLFYTSTIRVIHPPLKWTGNLKRAYSYGCGGGWILAHYRFPFWYASGTLLWKTFAAFKALLCCNFRLAGFHFSMGLGKFFTYLKMRLSA